jgi:hypothetical protein
VADPATDAALDSTHESMTGCHARTGPDPGGDPALDSTHESMTGSKPGMRGWSERTGIQAPQADRTRRLAAYHGRPRCEASEAGRSRGATVR